MVEEVKRLVYRCNLGHTHNTSNEAENCEKKAAEKLVREKLLDKISVPIRVRVGYELYHCYVFNTEMEFQAIVHERRQHDKWEGSGLYTIKRIDEEEEEEKDYYSIMKLSHKIMINEQKNYIVNVEKKLEKQKKKLEKYSKPDFVDGLLRAFTRANGKYVMWYKMFKKTEIWTQAGEPFAKRHTYEIRHKYRMKLHEEHVNLKKGDPLTPPLYISFKLTKLGENPGTEGESISAW